MNMWLIREYPKGTIHSGKTVRRGYCPTRVSIWSLWSSIRLGFQGCPWPPYIYIYIYTYIYIHINIMRGKKDATTYSRQACFVNRFTLQGFKRECREYVVASFFPLIIFILLCFNLLSTVPCENWLADFLYIYIYICLSDPNER